MTVLQFLAAGVGVVTLRALWLLAELRVRHHPSGRAGGGGGVAPAPDA